MNQDKRKVSTDALETLGTIIDETGKRDAIHLAVEPVIAGEKLHPGQHIGITDGVAMSTGKKLGIVDPFLSKPVFEGERFWLVIYPRVITSLRHVWSHPEFPEEITGTIESLPDDEVSKSKRWIEGFAVEIDQTYNKLMRAAELWVIDSEYTYDNSESYKAHWDKFPEFWKHYQIVTGTALPESLERDSFFTCSC